MPHFSPDGFDMYICQVCGRDLCSGRFPSVWRPDITGHKSAGNVCPTCLKEHELKKDGSKPNPTPLIRGSDLQVKRELENSGPISLWEHCKQESGETDPAKIRAYLNRYYGHD